MKKIVVTKHIPQPAPPPRVEIDTQLTGQELIAYVTEKGTICTLHRLSKDHADKERYGFVNMAYSTSSSPVFSAASWWEAIKIAGVSRQLYAFDSYDELIMWIGNTFLAIKQPGTGADRWGKYGAHIEQKSTAEMVVTKGKDPSNEPWVTPKQRISVQVHQIPREDMDLNGAGQINHTHKNMTTIFNKVNELALCLNLAYTRNKARIFAMAYGGTPPVDVEFAKQEAEEILRDSTPEDTLKIVRSDFMIMLDKVIEASKKEDKSHTRMTQVMTDIFNKLGGKSKIKFIDIG